MAVRRADDLGTVRYYASSKKTHEVVVCYAPMEHVNEAAKIVIVGITPGEDQAARAFEGAQRALHRGSALDAALREAKLAGSFGGNGGMRERLVDALNLVGFSRHFKLQCSAVLFEPSCDLAHFTSLLKFPVFVNRRGYDGKTPVRLEDDVRLRYYHQEYFVKEIARLRNSLFLPLGQVVRDRLAVLAAEGILDRRQILPWLLHPSKNNRSRYDYLLGRVSRENASKDTNVANIDVMREALEAAFDRLSSAGHWKALG